MALPAPDLDKNSEEETLVAIVDLDTLTLPEPEIPEPEIEPTKAPPPPEKFSLEEPEMEEISPEAEPEPQPIDLAQLTGGIAAPPPLPPVEMEAEPVPEGPSPNLSESIAEEISEPALPEPEPLEMEEAPEPELEALPLEEALPPNEEETIEEALEIPEPAPSEEPPEENVEEVVEEIVAPQAVMEADDAPIEEAPVEETPAQAGSKPPTPTPPETPSDDPTPETEPDTPTEKASEKLVVASVKKPLEEEKPLAPVPPPPPPKTSKEKIKKVGLLGLLKTGTKKSRKNRPLLAKRMPRKSKTLKKQTSSFRPVGTEERIARLKRDVLGTEQQRLMRRQPLPGRGRSEIEISQGAGRNYNIVASAIQKKSNALATVYSSLLQANPNLQGNVLVEFEISPKGQVTKCTILTSSLGNPQFEKKLVQEILHWTFHPTKKGKTTVLYPLSFFPSG